MAETTPPNLEEISTSKSILASTIHIPIAQLTPLLITPASRSLKAIVTLTWPYSSATGSVAFLLAEPDFRLRRTRGQVRAQFSGSSAGVVAKSGIASGDEVILCLDGVEWIEGEAAAANATPGRSVEFELKFTERLLLQFRPEESPDVKFINIDHPVPEPVPSTVSIPQAITATELPTPTIPTIPTTPAPFTSITKTPTDEFSSPAFIKRARTSYGSLFDANYDPFEQEDGSVRGKGRKRTRLSTSWRFTSKSPSPSPEVEEREATPLENVASEPASRPTTADEAVQTIEVETGLETSMRDIRQRDNSYMITENIRINGGVQLAPSEPPVQPQISRSRSPEQESMPPPQQQLDTAMLGPDMVFEPDENQLPETVGRLPSSPELRPQPSDGLPLVSPLVTSRFEPTQHNTQNAIITDQQDLHNQFAASTEDTPQNHVPEVDLYTASPPRTNTSGLDNFNEPAPLTENVPIIQHADSSLAVGLPNDFFTQEPTHPRSSDTVLNFDVTEAQAVQSHPLESSPNNSPYPSQFEVDSTGEHEYPDPETVQAPLAGWQARNTVAYPDPPDVYSHSASHSPYPLLPHAPRSQSAQTHAVDLTESDRDSDEDAEGFSEEDFGDNEQQYLSNSHSQADMNDDAAYMGDEDNEGYIQRNGHVNNRNHSELPREYEQDGSDTYDSDGNRYDDGYDSEGEFDDEDENEEGDYSDDLDENMNQDMGKQAAPPVVIDLLSDSEEEDAANDQSKPPLHNAHAPELQPENREQSSEGEEEGEESEYSVGEESDLGEEEDVPTYAPKSMEVIEGSSSESNDDTFIHGDDEVIGDADVDGDGDQTEELGVSVYTDEEMSVIQQDNPETNLPIHMDTSANLNHSMETQNSLINEANSTDQRDTEINRQPMEFDVYGVCSDAIPPLRETETDTDNLDGLMEKLESSETEGQAAPIQSNFPPMEVDTSSEEIETETNQSSFQRTERVDTYRQGIEVDAATPLQASPQSESHDALSEDDSPMEVDHAFKKTGSEGSAASAHVSEQPESTEIIIEDDSPPLEQIASPARDTENEAQQHRAHTDATAVLAGSMLQSPPKVSRATLSGWNQSPEKKRQLFQSIFGADGANEEEEEPEADVSYPALPVDDSTNEEYVEPSQESSHSQDITEDIGRTTRLGNGQLVTPDDTQKTVLSQVSYLSVSDQLQEQLQEEMAEELVDIAEYSPTHSSKSLEIYQKETGESSQGTEILDLELDSMEQEDHHLVDIEAGVSDLDMAEVDKIVVTKTEIEIVEEEGEFEENTIELAVIERESIDRKHHKTEGFLEISDSGLAASHDLSHETTLVQVEEDIVEETRTTIEQQVEIEEQVEEDVVEETRTITEQEVEVEEQAEEDIVEETRTTIEQRVEIEEPEAAIGEQIEQEPSISQMDLEDSQTRPAKGTKTSKKETSSQSPRQTRSQKFEPVGEIEISPRTPVKSSKKNETPVARSIPRSTRSPSIVLDKQQTPQGYDASAELALESVESPIKAGHHLRGAPITDPRVRLSRYLRTDLSEYVTLKILRLKMGKSKLDVLAIATSVPKEPQRGKSGPRNFLSTFTITDQTMAPTGVVEVQIFRPFQDALPTPAIGDGILLRNFSVLAAKGKGFILRSEDSSSWAVFKDEGTEIEVKGPPVEYGAAEKKHVKDLREWFHDLDAEAMAKLERAVASIEAKSPSKGITPEKAKK